MTELQTDRVIIEKLVWEIAQAKANEYPANWETSRADADLPLRRDIAAAMTQHGYEDVPGLIPHILKMLECGEIKAFSTFNGLPFVEVAQVARNLANWFMTDDDAMRVKAAFQLPADAPATKVEAVKRSITKQQTINAFDGIHFDRNGWSNALEDVPKWIEPCRVTLGRKGDKTSPATWNPVLIAAALIDKRITAKQLDAVFVRLNDWADEWREVSASFRD